MHRLLQGDVGAGKTVVALAALLVAVQGGHQGALMAPTEVLAEQHYAGVRWLLRHVVMPDESTLTQDRPVRVELLTNRTTPTERARLHDGLRAGTVDILVGTHALLTEEVAFASLGVVVVDEQHRFGVEQRDILRGKGRYSGGADPDVLVMTATPIPRTAAMTMYGDLDVTVLDELPPGRTPVQTTWARGPLEVESAWNTVRTEVAVGRQAYVVCPLVEDSERVQARSATQERERLAREDLPGLRLRAPPRPDAGPGEGVGHGRLQGRQDRRSGGHHGHRGRCGRPHRHGDGDRGRRPLRDGPAPSASGSRGPGEGRILVLPARRGLLAEGEKRLEALQESTDGFHLAEVDLDLRGEGTVLGTRQKGRSDLKLASLRRDRELVTQARQMAFDIVDGDPTLGAHDLLADEVRLMIDEDEAEFLFKS